MAQEGLHWKVGHTGELFILCSISVSLSDFSLKNQCRLRLCFLGSCAKPERKGHLAHMQTCVCRCVIVQIVPSLIILSASPIHHFRTRLLVQWKVQWKSLLVIACVIDTIFSGVAFQC